VKVEAILKELFKPEDLQEYQRPRGKLEVIPRVSEAEDLSFNADNET
jgi:hypothetical protein